MTYSITFAFGTFSTSIEALNFISAYINFEIGAIASPKSYPDGYDVFDVVQSKKLLTENKDSSFMISDEINHHHEEKRRVVFRKDVPHCLDIFFIKIVSRADFKISEFLQSKLIPHLRIICYYDEIKSLWQSEKSISMYEMSKRPHQHLRKKMDPSLPPLLANRIDIFYNPGHQKFTYTMFLMAAPEIWFGNQSLIYFPKRRLLSFPKALKIEAMENNIIYVNLFDSRTSDYESEKVLSVQREFRSWVRMDEIELELDKKLS